eukprot:492594-Prorocentrum_minimum.AAC.2
MASESAKLRKQLEQQQQQLAGKEAVTATVVTKEKLDERKHQKHQHKRSYSNAELELLEMYINVVDDGGGSAVVELKRQVRDTIITPRALIRRTGVTLLSPPNTHISPQHTYLTTKHETHINLTTSHIYLTPILPHI